MILAILSIAIHDMQTVQDQYHNLHGLYYKYITDLIWKCSACKIIYARIIIINYDIINTIQYKAENMQYGFFKGTGQCTYITKWAKYT